MSVFARYLSASTISYFGTGVSSLALPLVAILILDASSFEVSLVTASANVGWLLIGLPAGVIVSHLPLRATQVAMDLTRAMTLLSVPVAAVFDVLTVTQLVAVGILVGLCAVLFDVSNSTFIVTVVEKDELTRRNSQTSTALSAAQLAGPTIGGLVVQLVGAVASILVDVASYVISALLLRSIPSREAAPKPPEAGSVRAQIRDGIDYILRRPVLRACTVHVTIVNFVCGGILALTPVMLVRELHAEPFVVGFLLAMDGVGSLVAAAFTARLVAALGSARTLVAAAVAFAATSLLMPLAWGRPVGFALFGVGLGASAGAVTIISIVLRTHRQTVTPLEFLPRVMATVRFVSWGAVPIGALGAGGLASVTDTRVAFVAICVVGLLAPAQLLFSRVRRLVSLEDDRESEPASLT